MPLIGCPEGTYQDDANPLPTVPDSCLPCPLTLYCLANSLNAEMCPEGTYTRMVGASSIDDCLPPPIKYLYQNLNFPVLADNIDLYKVYKVSGPFTHGSTIWYKVVCDSTFPPRFGEAECTFLTTFILVF